MEFLPAPNESYLTWFSWEKFIPRHRHVSRPALIAISISLISIQLMNTIPFLFPVLVHHFNLTSFSSVKAMYFATFLEACYLFYVTDLLIKTFNNSKFDKHRPHHPVLYRAHVLVYLQIVLEDVPYIVTSLNTADSPVQTMWHDHDVMIIKNKAVSSLRWVPPYFSWLVSMHRNGRKRHRVL